MRTIKFFRNLFLGLSLSLVLAACGGPQSGSSNSAGAAKLQLQDIIVGEADAPLTLIEYASWTCAACLDFHTRIMPDIKTNYIDTGKVKLIFREFPTAPANLSVAGFVIARCAGVNNYTDVVDELFSRQSAFITLARNGDQVTEALKQVARNHGIADDAAYDACMQAAENRDAIRASIAAGRAIEVTGTPTFILNGTTVPASAHISVESFSEVLDTALATAN